MAENVASNVSVDAQSNAANTATHSAPTEKLLTQSEVNDLIGSVKQKAYEKGKQEALNSGNSYAAQPVSNAQNAYAAQPNVHSQQQNMGGMPTMDENYFRRLAAEEAQRVQNQLAGNYAAQQEVASFAQRIKAGEQDFPDLVKRCSAISLDDASWIIPYANKFDNTAAIMDDLVNNPAKLVTIRELLKSSPSLGEQEMRKISDSIKANKKALEAPIPNAPLSQLKSSPVGSGAGDTRTVADWKKIWRV